MAEARAKESSGGYQDFDVEVQEGDTNHRYVLRVNLLKQTSEKQLASKWLKQGLSSCTRFVGINVKESHSKTKTPTSPTKSDIGINWNGVVDFVIQLAIKELLKNGGSGELPLPDILPPTPEPGGFFKTRFTATGGVFGDFTTLERIGDATAFKHGTDVALEVAVGLRDLVVRYARYEAGVCGCVFAKGGVTLRVGRNSTHGRVTLSVRRRNECQVTLSDVRVTLSDVRVKLTGLGPLNWFASKMAAWYVRRMREDIARHVEEMVTSHVTEMLEGLRCDDLIVMLKT